MPIASDGPAHVTRGAIASAEVAKAGAFNDSLLFDPNRRRFAWRLRLLHGFLRHNYKIYAVLNHVLLAVELISCQMRHFAIPL